MKKELPINIHSVMTSYSYYAFPQCIITAGERIGQRVAEFEILDTRTGGWQSRGHIQNTGNGNWAVISEDKYRRNCNGCIYRKLEQNDYIKIRVDFQQYTQPWAAVNLFITDDEENILCGDNQYLCRFGYFIYDGLNLYLSGEKQEIENKKFSDKYKLLLKRSGNTVEIYAGEEKEKLVAVRELVNLDKQDVYIGVQVKHGDNSAIPWLLSNYIQLSCDVTNRDRRLEYHYGLLKHWDCNLFHYFLDANRFSYDTLLQLGGVRFVKKMLCEGKYIELILDQYYIPGRSEYGQFHDYHQNLLYGYDDSSKCFLLVGYTNSGKLEKTIITYEGLRQSLKQNRSEIAKVFTYAQDSYLYLFNAKYVKKMILHYLEGVNSSESFQNIVPQAERIYGIHIYEQLATKEGLDVLISDRRITHLLWEHKVCMRERILYLENIGVLDEQSSRALCEQMKEVENLVFDLKNIVLKYQMRPDKRQDAVLCKYLNNICNREEKCLRTLLDKWQGAEGKG